jgi:hypothetical protein
MVSLVTQQDRRAVQNLPFCYLCGKDFVDGDITNKDHLPPKSIFKAKDRDPLVLKSHKACNEAQTQDDEKIGQLIALRYRKVPKPENRRLQIVISPDGDAAVSNFNIEKAVWRDKLTNALNQALNDDNVRRRVVDMGSNVPDKTKRGQEPLAALLRSEIARWRPIIKAADIKGG